MQAIVDEAHRLGLKVACHTYGGEGMRICIAAGVDATQHALDLDDESIKMLVAKKTAARRSPSPISWGSSRRT